MDAIFDLCVDILIYFAGVFRITYKEINVWVFVIIWPILTIALIIWIFIQQRRIHRFQNLLGEKDGENND